MLIASCSDVEMSSESSTPAKEDVPDAGRGYASQNPATDENATTMSESPISDAESRDLEAESAVRASTQPVDLDVPTGDSTADSDADESADEDPPTQSKSTTELMGIGYVYADDLHYVKDVLRKAEIVAAITHSHGIRSIEVFEAEMDRAIKMLKEDSKLHGYKFTSIVDEQFTDPATDSEPMIEDLALLNRIIEASMSIGIRDTFRDERVARYSSQIEQMPQISVPVLNRIASAIDAWSDYGREDPMYAPARGLDALRARQKLNLTFVLYVLLQLERAHPEFRENPDAYFSLVPVSMVYRGQDKTEDRLDRSPWERAGDGFELAPFAIPASGRGPRPSSNARFLDQILRKYFDDKEGAPKSGWLGLTGGTVVRGLVPDSSG